MLVLASGASAEAPVIASIPNSELGHQALDGKNMSLCSLILIAKD